jgi:hypothetical protein
MRGMSTVVFTGPTLAGSTLPAGFRALPPAAEGDIHRAVKSGAAAVGLIDGRFENTPSVWHKEILWALSRGVPVFGAASMGALRAAELADFGMIGVGAIFRDYRDGRLQDDDDVAVLHAPAELGFVSLTDAMVDIRVTLERARRHGVISAGTARALAETGKALFFKDRTWAAILAQAAKHDLPARQRTALAQWLPANKVSQKRRDALAMLRAMSKSRRAVRPNFRFQHTEFWRNLVARP